MAVDLKIIETGNGGDLVARGRDLAIVNGFVNMPYLGMFGGNVAQTTRPRQLNEQMFDWWGNTALMPNQAATQFNSLTERALLDTPLNSAGRILIQQAVQRDLAFMQPFATVSVTVEIENVDRIRINILVLELNNLQRKEFQYIWDGTLLDFAEEVVTPAAALPGYRHGEQRTIFGANNFQLSPVFNNSNYTVVVVDNYGVGVQYTTLSKSINKWSIHCDMAGGLLTWVALLNGTTYPGMRAATVDLIPGINTITFEDLGTADHTTIPVDVYGYGIDFSGLNASRTSSSFQVDAPNGGRLFYFTVANNTFNVRAGSDFDLTNGENIVPITSLGSTGYTLLLFDTLYGGNIYNKTNNLNNFNVAVYNATKLNYVALI